MIIAYTQPSNYVFKAVIKACVKNVLKESKGTAHTHSRDLQGKSTGFYMRATCALNGLMG